MAQRDVIVIGGSAGALEPLKNILGQLPAGLRASTLVVMHTRGAHDGLLPDILGRLSKLPVNFAQHNEPLRHGHVYVAPADLHLIIASSAIRLVHGPRENGFRPAIDPLFRTAARELGPRVIGIILSGALSDGTYGLSLVKQHGGVAIVQDPEEADVSSMPKNALNAVDVDYILPAGDIAETVVRLIEERPAMATGRPGEHAMSRQDDDLEPQLPSEHTQVSEMENRFGPASSLTCPDCGGALWEVQEGRVLRYQCHVGHQYGPDVLDDEQRDNVDSALWSAVRVLEEHAELKMRLAKRAVDNGLEAVSKGFLDGARDAHSQAERIRSFLFTHTTAVEAGQPSQEGRHRDHALPLTLRKSAVRKKARTNRKA